MPEKPPFVHLHNHSDYSLLDGASKIESLVDTALGHGNAFPGTDRSRQSVRRHPVLQYRPQEGIEADHRLRNLRSQGKPSQKIRRRRPVQSPGPARRKSGRLSQSQPAGVLWLSGRILLQAAHRQRIAGAIQRRPDRPVGMPEGRRPAKAAHGTAGCGAGGSDGTCAIFSVRAIFISNCRITIFPRSSASIPPSSK